MEQAEMLQIYQCYRMLSAAIIMNAVECAKINPEENRLCYLNYINRREAKQVKEDAVAWLNDIGINPDRLVKTGKNAYKMVKNGFYGRQNRRSNKDLDKKYNPC